jgi:hypothetical protein
MVVSNRTDVFLVITSAKFTCLQALDVSFFDVSRTQGFVFGYVDKDHMRHVSYFLDPDPASENLPEGQFSHVKGIRRKVSASDCIPA